MFIQATLHLNIMTIHLLGHLILISKWFLLQNTPTLKHLKCFNYQLNQNSTNYKLMVAVNYTIL